MNIKKSDKILIVAPHADDESIGVGGLLSKFGKQCDVWLVTDGRKGNTPDARYTEEELIAIRTKEFKRVMDYYSVHDYSLFGLTDGRSSFEISKIYKSNIRDYKYIFVPNRYENHPDHITVYRALMKMKRKQKAKGDIVEYEVWTPLTAPNIYLTIADVINNKLMALSYYESQLESVDYVALAESLSHYRGLISNKEYSEAYYSHKKHYMEKKNSIASLLPKPVTTLVLKLLHK